MASLSVNEKLKLLGELHKTLKADRQQLHSRMKQLNMENQRLRLEKSSLLAYIKELEAFSVDRADLNKLKEIFHS